MWGILRLAYKLLVNDRAKFLALLVGITFAVFLIIGMTSLFAGMALHAQDAALASAKEALHLVQINYEAGLNTYLDVLVADEQYHQALTSDLQATAVRYQDTVALYVAVGGGWWVEGDGAPPGSYSRAWQQPLSQ